MAVEEYLDDSERQEYAEDPDVSDGSEDYGNDYYDSDYATDPPPADQDEDNPLIPITLTNEDGEEYVEEIPYADLAKIVKASKSGGQGQAGNIPEGSVEYQGAVTLLKEIQQNDLVKKILAYQSQGYSDDRIIAGLFQLNSQSKPEEPKEFATLADEVSYHVANALKQHIEPLKQDMTRQKWQAAKDYATRNNNAVMANAIKKFGFEDADISEQHLSKMVGALKSLYPEDYVERLGYTYDTLPLTQEQAEGIVALAFGGSKKPQGKQQGSNNRAAATLSKMQQLPKIMPGKSSEKSAEQGPRQRDNVSRSERLKRINELLQ